MNVARQQERWKGESRETLQGAPRSYLTSVLTGVRDVHRPAPKFSADMVAAESPRCIAVLRDGTAQEAVRFFERLILRGVSHEHLYEVLFPQIAAEMGEMWSCDDVTFADLSIAFSSLQIVMHRLRDGYVQREHAPNKGTLVIASLASETHLFGPILMSARLERLGYSVLTLGGATPAQLAKEAARNRHLCIGLSCGSTTARSELPAAIAAIQSSSATPIVVGGSVTLTETAQHLAQQVDLWGPDLTTLTQYLEKQAAHKLQSVN